MTFRQKILTLLALILFFFLFSLFPVSFKLIPSWSQAVVFIFLGFAILFSLIFLYLLWKDRLKNRSHWRDWIATVLYSSLILIWLFCSSLFSLLLNFGLFGPDPLYRFDYSGYSLRLYIEEHNCFPPDCYSCCKEYKNVVSIKKAFSPFLHRCAELPFTIKQPKQEGKRVKIEPYEVSNRAQKILWINLETEKCSIEDLNKEDKFHNIN